MPDHYHSSIQSDKQEFNVTIQQLLEEQKENQLEQVKKELEAVSEDITQIWRYIRTTLRRFVDR